MTQRGKCQRAVRDPEGIYPPWGNCGLPDEHDGDCVWEALLVKVQPALEDFTMGSDGTYVFQKCPDGDCPQQRTPGTNWWTIRAQIDAATEHNRRYHS